LIKPGYDDLENFLTTQKMMLSHSLHSSDQQNTSQSAGVIITNIADNDKSNFDTICNLFRQRNEGYDMEYVSDKNQILSEDITRVLLVQEIEGIANPDQRARAVIQNADGNNSDSEIVVGDIILIQKGETLQTDVEVSYLLFRVPQDPQHSLPSFIRPDWDPNIADAPGGCATEIDAYRRILLTWREDVGEYIYHALNIHRVRIYDSFSHYHPVENGFDEFYLVQMVEPGAKIIISEQVDLISNPDQVKKSDIDGLVREYELEAGDIVYLPRGVMHRGYGGVLAQVITIPGFIPGSEIGVDHLLREINENLGLTGNDALPFNEEFSEEQIIK
jgi:hypothetical protein